VDHHESHESHQRRQEELVWSAASIAAFPFSLLLNQAKENARAAILAALQIMLWLSSFV
jgi:hypothetical protein